MIIQTLYKYTTFTKVCLYANNPFSMTFYLFFMFEYIVGIELLLFAHPDAIIFKCLSFWASNYRFSLISMHLHMSMYVSMDGREIFQFALRQVPACIEEALSKSGESKENIDFYLLHQANARIIEGISKRLKEDIAKFPSNVSEVGNMSSASIPVLLDECVRSGKIQKGNRIVMSGFGAGLTFGASVLTL